MSLLSADAALARILDGVSPLGEETVAVGEADGRVLARDLAAALTQPPFNSSAMDGYAVFGSAAASPGDRWEVVGQSAAGRGFSGAVSQGQAVRIFTGAPVPDGCGTVVIQENVTREGDVIVATDATTAGANIRVAGVDFRAGEIALRRGRRLDPHALTLAAAMGQASLPVIRRPVVAILATGDELVPPGTPPGPDQIISSNPIGLAALVTRAGGTARLLGIAPDKIDAITARIRDARDADVLITIGGASVGDLDLVGPALEREGIALDFWKVAIRPGKPLMFGKLGQQRVLGLPGNPVSALITARVFLLPLIGALLGAPRATQTREVATLTAPLDANGPRLHLMRAKLGRGADGTLSVSPMPSQDSSLLSALSEADCLIWRGPDADALAPGASVEIERLAFR
ncbi:gephyrin-like molybdotransferase Glp [Hyphomicrobium sp. LHD-15]|uniref:molybdopterin molybdotransferase MoeA n=1 Tax=Hyphomicrobium sp. LHD-15 TaxID=3072142 RepID=UPI00280FDCA8|nr:gephyrin-like molybdotransferase Glp [Hyphomicrobium sp. LHD-15]MDQ8700368.1 molybdopterin molybdotransferase MoeA [Hyphomicrobium sp. LHD-15]